MASFDALLQLLVAQGAESLTLAAGAVPELARHGEPVALSMPPLPAETLARFVGEIGDVGTDADGRYVLDAKGRSIAFDVVLDGETRIEFRRSGAQPSGAEATAGADADGADRVGGRGDDTAGELGGAQGADAGAEPIVARTEDVAAVERLLAAALEMDATDLFLSTSTDARVRVGTRLRELPDTRCRAEAILAALGVDAGTRARLDAGRSIDLALRVAGGRIRANVFRQRAGLAAAVRPIRRVRSLEELALPSDLAQLMRYADGLVVMVGPAGSGKSSTLAALVDHLNRTRACHVVTIEDPVEFEYEPGRCLINQREVGRDVSTFSSGLRACLRQSPDVILLGEMRDPETISAALTAAETGHLVISTLHAGSADMAIDRIIDAFAPHQQEQVRTQLASVLRAVVTQLLLPGIGDAALVPALEKMIVTHAIAHSIRESRGHQIASHIQTGRADGMVSLEMSLAQLVRRRMITRETALSAARNEEVVTKLLAS